MPSGAVKLKLVIAMPSSEILDDRPDAYRRARNLWRRQASADARDQPGFEEASYRRVEKLRIGR